MTCENKVWYRYVRGSDIAVDCGSIDPHGNRALCAECLKQWERKDSHD